jgi:DNA-binding XRE family transcriptional regulator
MEVFSRFGQGRLEACIRGRLLSFGRILSEKRDFPSKLIYYFLSKILYLATLRITFPSEVYAMKSIQQKIRGLREDNDLTQTQVAQVLGTSQTMYARYERGANELPIRHLITLCRFYNVSADYFLDTEPDQRRRKGHH